jgi:hypothetical protein
MLSDYDCIFKLFRIVGMIEVLIVKMIGVWKMKGIVVSRMRGLRGILIVIEGSGCGRGMVCLIFVHALLLRRSKELGQISQVGPTS